MSQAITTQVLIHEILVFKYHNIQFELLASLTEFYSIYK